MSFYTTLRQSGAPPPPSLQPRQAPTPLRPHARDHSSPWNHDGTTNLPSQNRRGGGTPYQAGRGPPLPLTLPEDRPPPPPVSSARTGSHPPTVARPQARPSLESRRSARTAGHNQRGGWEPLLCPEGYPPPSGNSRNAGPPTSPVLGWDKVPSLRYPGIRMAK